MVVNLFDYFVNSLYSESFWYRVHVCMIENLLDNSKLRLGYCSGWSYKSNHSNELRILYHQRLIVSLNFAKVYCGFPPTSFASFCHLQLQYSLNYSCMNKIDGWYLDYFLLNEQPSVNRAFPPVGWHRTVEQPAQITTVCAWEKTVVIVKQPGHFTSIKKDRGAGTKFLSLCFRASAAGVGFRRSTARTILHN